ncbi:MAG: hypothetical protein A2W22_05515 [Candidatus Levybacteria bacterium RBG_16_35_11]|nr:MAG: hypothetical protein A2W22_05515 [Candidatus Levybacteria bacterium RBG_16_35_11]
MILFAFSLMIFSLVTGLTAKVNTDIRTSNGMFTASRIDNASTGTLNLVQSNTTVFSPGDFFSGSDRAYNASDFKLTSGTDYTFNPTNGKFVLQNVLYNDSKLNFSAQYRSDTAAGSVVSNGSQGIFNLSKGSSSFGSIMVAIVVLTLFGFFFAQFVQFKM